MNRGRVAPPGVRDWRACALRAIFAGRGRSCDTSLAVAAPTAAGVRDAVRERAAREHPFAGLPSDPPLTGRQMKAANPGPSVNDAVLGAHGHHDLGTSLVFDSSILEGFGGQNGCSAVCTYIHIFKVDVGLPRHRQDLHD